MRILRIVFVASIPALVVLACGSRDETSDSHRVPVRFSRASATGAASPEMQDGDIRIMTADGGLDLALIGDTISSGLSPHALTKVRQETDTGAVKGSGFGANLERMVKGTVQSAIATRMVFPLSDVRDVRYDGQKLVFEWNGKPQAWGKVNVNGKDFLESFSADDAQQFVVAVRARKRAMGRRM